MTGVMAREKNKWHCIIADEEDSTTTELDVEAYWDYSKVELSEVATAAAAIHTTETRRRHIPISAVLVVSE